MIRGSETATPLVQEFAKLKQNQYYITKRTKQGKIPARDALGLLNVDYQVITLTSEGKSLKEISNEVGRTMAGVFGVRWRLMQKFKCVNPAQLIAVCYKKGILRLEEQEDAGT